MKKNPPCLAAVFPAAASALLAAAFISCSPPTNRYIESAALNRLPHGFTPILRNDDERTGLEIGAGI